MANSIDFKQFSISAFLFIATSAGYSQQILVPPYIQPGNAPKLAKEKKIILWQTDSVAAVFTVEYVKGSSFLGTDKIVKAKISFAKLRLKGKTTFLYRADLSRLEFDEIYSYRVSLPGKIITETSFTTRTKKQQTRFVAFGDCGAGTPQQAKIAYQVYAQKPQFVLVTGDIAYSNGLESDYRKNFFPYYTASTADTLTGAPLMNSIPFYVMLGNHDVHGANLDKFPDGLAYFYYNDLPLNAPSTELTLKAEGSAETIKTFKKNTEPRFPRMVNFSFDYGNVHITCLDANYYTNPLDPDLLVWLANDIKSSQADWKIVSFHHPGFNSSKAHYDDQQMRLLAPMLEKLEVDIVLNGHVHNYQRSVPLTFSPMVNESGTEYIITPEGRVDGTFVLDNNFDGVTNTKPKGIIYIVTGAGGGQLYDARLSNNPDLWKHDLPKNWVPFTVKLISDIHTFTLVETDGKKLTLKQMDANGNVVDAITISK